MSAPDTATVAAVLAAHNVGNWREIRGRYGRFCTCGEMLDARDVTGSHRTHLAAALLASEPIAQALAAADAVARVEALDRGHVGHGCTFPDDACVCAVPLFDLRAAIRPEGGARG